MKKAFAAWKWSLGVVARSYRTVVGLAALIAIWSFAAYKWLGLGESSVLLLILALIWAIVQLLAAVAILGGVFSAAATTEGPYLPIRSLWTGNRKTLLNTLGVCLASVALVWLCSAVFAWINAHSIEVASFLTFRSQRPVSHVRIEKIYSVVEALWWIVFSGFLLSFLLALLRSGWRGAGKQTRNLLAGCAFRTLFLASLLSVVVFGGIAYELANWHPRVTPGFWDYTQMVARISLVLILISTGVLFWSLSLARLQAPKQDSPQV